MKSKVLLLFFLLSSTYSFSQKTNYILGNIVDSLTNQPLEYVSISIISVDSSKTMGGALTNKLGAFKIRSNYYGKCKVLISIVGYESRQLTNILLHGVDINIGTVKVILTSKKLDEVTVSTLKNNIENTFDRTIFKIGVNEQSETTVDILKKVPFVSVDGNGIIRIRDEGNIKLLINGRPTNVSIGDLKSMTGNMLKSIEVITSPSAKYDGEGIGGLININLRKDSNLGINGAAFLTLGTRSSVIGNDTYLKSKKILIINNISGTFDRLISGFDFTRTTISGGDNYSQFQNSEALSKTLGFNESVSMDYQVNKSSFLNFGLKFNTSTADNRNNLKSEVREINNVFSQNYDSRIDNLYTPLVLSTNVDFVKTFKNPEHNLSFFTTYLYNQENTKNTIIPQGEISLITSNQNVNIITNKEFTIQSDYIKPLRKSDLFEFGVKYINRVYMSNSEYYIKSSQNIYIKDTLSTQLIKPINYTQDIFASYVSIQISLNDRTRFRLGLRYEMTNNLILSNVKQTYANLLPNFLLSRKVNSNITLRLTYNNRIQRPSIYYLNPFIDNSDPTNLRLGNNRLLSENSNSFEFSINKLLKKGFFSPYLFYRLSDGLIQPIRTIEGNITKTIFENIGKSSNVGIGYSIGFPIGKKTNFNSFGSVSNYSLTSPFSATQNGIIGNVGANFSFRISTKFSFDGYATYSSPRIYVQGKGNKNYFNSFTFRYKINSISRLNLIIDNPFYENVKASTIYSGPDFSTINTRYYVGRAIRLNYYIMFGSNNSNRSKKSTGVDNDDVKGKDEGLFVK